MHQLYLWQEFGLKYAIDANFQPMFCIAFESSDLVIGNLFAMIAGNY